MKSFAPIYVAMTCISCILCKRHVLVSLWNITFARNKKTKMKRRKLCKKIRNLKYISYCGGGEYKKNPLIYSEKMSFACDFSIKFYDSSYDDDFNIFTMEWSSFHSCRKTLGFYQETILMRKSIKWRTETSAFFPYSKHLCHEINFMEDCFMTDTLTKWERFSFEFSGNNSGGNFLSFEMENIDTQITRYTAQWPHNWVLCCWKHPPSHSCSLGLSRSVTQRKMRWIFTNISLIVRVLVRPTWNHMNVCSAAISFNKMIEMLMRESVIYFSAVRMIFAKLH